MSGPSPQVTFDKAASRPKGPAKRKLPPPVSIRLTAEERARLVREAGKLSLSAYIRLKLFGENAAPRKARYTRKQRRPSPDHEILARLLGLLGQSELATSLIALALAAQTGALPVTEDVSGKLETACEEIHEMRVALILALGIKPESGGSPFAGCEED